MSAKMIDIGSPPFPAWLARPDGAGPSRDWMLALFGRAPT